MRRVLKLMCGRLKGGGLLRGRRWVDRETVELGKEISRHDDAFAKASHFKTKLFSCENLSDTSSPG